jgi:NADH-quinone oxidoreductase subunit J
VIDSVLFYALAALALGSAVVVVAQRNPIYSALGLIVTLCSLSGIYGLLASPFIAALQVIVYAGAIMVLFLFVLMLLGAQRDPDRGGGARVLAGVALALVAVLALQAGVVLAGAGLGTGASGFEAGTRRVAELLFSARYLYAFEATSVLILAALVGAVALAKKDL